MPKILNKGYGEKKTKPSRTSKSNSNTDYSEFAGIKWFDIVEKVKSKKIVEEDLVVLARVFYPKWLEVNKNYEYIVSRYSYGIIERIINDELAELKESLKAPFPWSRICSDNTADIYETAVKLHSYLKSKNLI